MESNKILFTFFWYLNILDYKTINTLKKEKKDIERIKRIKERLYLFEFPMSKFISMI